MSKVCTRCKGAPQPVENFRKDASRKDGLTQYCADCLRAAEANTTRPYDDNSAVRARAKLRAQRRLVELHRDDYDRLLTEETEIARTELAELKQAASSKPAAHAHPGSKATVVPLLKGGPRPTGQSITDRIREDVGRCTVCIGQHDKGHVCPASRGETNRFLAQGRDASMSIEENHMTPDPTPAFDATVAALGFEPDLSPAPDYEVTVAQAVLVLAGHG